MPAAYYLSHLGVRLPVETDAGIRGLVNGVVRTPNSLKLHTPPNLSAYVAEATFMAVYTWDGDLYWRIVPGLSSHNHQKWWRRGLSIFKDMQRYKRVAESLFPLIHRMSICVFFVAGPSSKATKKDSPFVPDSWDASLLRNSHPPMGPLSDQRTCRRQASRLSLRRRRSRPAMVDRLAWREAAMINAGRMLKELSYKLTGLQRLTTMTWSAVGAGDFLCQSNHRKEEYAKSLATVVAFSLVRALVQNRDADQRADQEDWGTLFPVIARARGVGRI